MKIILSKYAGFCYGVDNAVKIAEKVLKKNKKKDIYMLGELVHNKDTVKKIKEQGVKLEVDIKRIPEDSLVILSAHGHSPQVYKEAKKRKLKIVDATCPMVSKVHILGKMLAKQGYFMIVVGDKNHNEVKATYEQIRSVAKDVKIIENAKQADQIAHLKKIGIVSQTTQSLEHFCEIIEAIMNFIEEIRIFNTICDATRERQKATLNLADKVDLMIVVGSFNSANTRRLTELCREIVETHQINSEKELIGEWFRLKKTVGITAGASTPKWVIKDVLREIRRYGEKYSPPIYRETFKK